MDWKALLVKYMVNVEASTGAYYILPASPRFFTDVERAALWQASLEADVFELNPPE